MRVGNWDRWIAISERGIQTALIIMAVCAPMTITGTQIGFAAGMAFWGFRLLFPPRPRFHFTTVSFFLWLTFFLTLVSIAFSYDFYLSLDRMRWVILFFIVFLVAENVRSRSFLRLMVALMLCSSAATGVFTLVQRAVGRGVKLSQIDPNSTLFEAGVRSGDTILSANGGKVSSPEELVERLDRQSSGTQSSIRVYRYELYIDFPLPEKSLAGGGTALSRLGASGWERGRDWRATGFYSHYATYAEVLQMNASLAFGLLLTGRRKGWTRPFWTLLAVLPAAAMLLSATRAPILALFASMSIIVLLVGSKRALVLSALAVSAMAVAGLAVLKQQRNVAVVDGSDNSLIWRSQVYRDCLGVVFGSFRHALVGVGIDSVITHWKEWGMFRQGKMAIGHMHSSPLQIAFERGIPALLAWLALLFVYGRTLTRRLKAARTSPDDMDLGIVAGALGGLAGFFLSGLVHNNQGDSLVIMTFYIVMGMALSMEYSPRSGPFSPPPVVGKEGAAP